MSVIKSTRIFCFTDDFVLRNMIPPLRQYSSNYLSSVLKTLKTRLNAPASLSTIYCEEHYSGREVGCSKNAFCTVSRNSVPSAAIKARKGVR